MIDTDGGADDAAAILLALSAWANRDSDFEVVAITCVNGNTDEKQVQENVLKTITIANASNVYTFFIGKNFDFVNFLILDYCLRRGKETVSGKRDYGLLLREGRFR